MQEFVSFDLDVTELRTKRRVFEWMKRLTITISFVLISTTGYIPWSFRHIVVVKESHPRSVVISASQTVEWPGWRHWEAARRRRDRRRPERDRWWSVRWTWGRRCRANDRHWSSASNWRRSSAVRRPCPTCSVADRQPVRRTGSRGLPLPTRCRPADRPTAAYESATSPSLHNHILSVSAATPRSSAVWPLSQQFICLIISYCELCISK